MNSPPADSCDPDRHAPGPIDVVAIDGPSGSGKSTVARALARELGWSYLDTGAMYRAVTWKFLEAGIAPLEVSGDDPLEVRRMRDCLASIRLSLSPSGGVEIDGEDVTPHLRSREVESQVSAVSALPFVREAMRKLQREVARKGPVVAEGRDMGSVVFPNARFRIFLDADAEERARRRQLDFEARGRIVSREEVLREIEVRDHLDSTRRDAPLRRVEDARYFDSTDKTVDQVVQEILAWIRETGIRETRAIGGEPA
ncbi:MAG: (d)CMP kinase [Planctomycetota bacterium]